MKYYRCKCGRHEAWSSMGVLPCVKCLDCGSSLAMGPNGHVPPLPHEFIATHVDTDDGKAVLHRCKWCQKTKAQVEKEESNDRIKRIDNSGDVESTDG